MIRAAALLLILPSIAGCASAPIDGASADYTGTAFARQQHERQSREMAAQQKQVLKEQKQRIQAERRRQKEILAGQFAEPPTPPKPPSPPPPPKDDKLPEPPN